jgi:ABC-type Fe3+/spermidine/putrescine transport system ATPase subunit
LTLRPLETLLANQLQGQVVDQVYIGTDTYYSVRLASGQTIRVREQNNLAALRQGAQPGDTVCVQFAAETASVLTG